MCERSKSLILGLLRKIDRMEKENAKIRAKSKMLWAAMLLSWLVIVWHVQMLKMVEIEKHRLLQKPGIEKALGNRLLVSFALIAYSVVRYLCLHHLSFLPKTNNN
ncbi:unnamed protein product [Prunus brigantina]